MRLDKFLKKINLPFRLTGDSGDNKRIFIGDAESEDIIEADNDDVPHGQGRNYARYIVHAANILPALAAAVDELYAANNNSQRVVVDYPAGTCNAEDSHREAGERLHNANAALASVLARAKEVK